MIRSITMHGVEFEIEFEDTEDGGEVIDYYIKGDVVTEVVRDATKWAIQSTVNHNAKRWADEYRREQAGESREELHQHLALKEAA